MTGRLRKRYQRVGVFLINTKKVFGPELISLLHNRDTSVYLWNIILHLGFWFFVNSVHFYRHSIPKALHVTPKLAKETHLPHLYIAE